MEDRKQVILAKLYSNIEGGNVLESKVDVSKAKTRSYSSIPNIVINGVHKGCDNSNETWNLKGKATKGSSWVSIQQSFPSHLSSGKTPNCASWDWENNIHLRMNDLFDRNKGCISNLITSPITSYWINCKSPLQGFWIANIIADYEFHIVSGYTLVVL